MSKTRIRKKAASVSTGQTTPSTATSRLARRARQFRLLPFMGPTQTEPYEARPNPKVAPSVLLIEDDESVCDAIVASLEAIGVGQITLARDGASGLAMIDSVHPWVVLLDLMLPVTDGFDVLARLRQRRSGYQPKRVVVISAMSDSLSESALTQLGADRVLSKPFTLDRLEAAVSA